MSGGGGGNSSSSSSSTSTSSSGGGTTAGDGASAGGGGGGGGGSSEDACCDYQSSLEDLTFNSKPHINMLTILAEENVPFAKDIVSLIEAQIAKVFIHSTPNMLSLTPSPQTPSPTPLFCFL